MNQTSQPSDDLQTTFTGDAALGCAKYGIDWTCTHEAFQHIGMLSLLSIPNNMILQQREWSIWHFMLQSTCCINSRPNARNYKLPSGKLQALRARAEGDAACSL